MSKFLFKLYKPKKMDYCPKCHKRTECIKHSGWKMCKVCGLQERA